MRFGYVAARENTHEPRSRKKDRRRALARGRSVGTVNSGSLDLGGRSSAGGLPAEDNPVLWNIRDDSRPAEKEAEAEAFRAAVSYLAVIYRTYRLAPPFRQVR
jgi:hypothetical protein